MENDTTSGKLMNVIKKLSNQNIENVKRVEELENQPAQRVPRFRILVPVVKQLAQEPPAFRPRRTQLDRLAIKPDRVLDAVSPIRRSSYLVLPVVTPVITKPPAFRARRAQLDRLAIMPDRVLDAVSPTRL